MIRRVLLVLGAGFVLNTTGCALLSALAVPFELLFSFFGLIGDGLLSVGDAIVYAEMIDGPTPVVERVDGGAYALTGIAPGARFDVVCAAPGYAVRRYRWPEDLAHLAEHGGEIRCVLQPSAGVSASGRGGG